LTGLYFSTAFFGSVVLACYESLGSSFAGSVFAGSALAGSVLFSYGGGFFANTILNVLIFIG
jgi:hypothetical protein